MRERPVPHPPGHERDQLPQVGEAVLVVRLHLGDPLVQARSTPEVGVLGVGAHGPGVVAEVHVRVQGRPALVVRAPAEVLVELVVGAGAADLAGAAPPPAAPACGRRDAGESETDKGERYQSVFGEAKVHHAVECITRRARSCWEKLGTQKNWESECADKTMSTHPSTWSIPDALGDAPSTSVLLTWSQYPVVPP